VLPTPGDTTPHHAKKNASTAILDAPAPAPVFVFDEKTHRYTINGRDVPSVTDVFYDLGMLDDILAIGKERLEQKRQIGQAAHKATVLDDRGVLVLSSVDRRVLPYLNAWRRFRVEHHVRPIRHEQAMFSTVNRLAGTVDFIGVMDGVLAVIEKKTTAELHPCVPLQLAAYSLLAEAHLPELLREAGIRWTAEDRLHRYVVKLEPDSTYKLQPFTDPRDRLYFLNALSSVHWKWNNGLRRARR
jgi:hypothetical protein